MAKKLRNTFWKAVVILSIILMPVWAWGATYYVNTSTGSDGNNGSLATPWQHTEYALLMLAAGDTLNIVAPATNPDRGTYVTNIDGTSGSRIVVQGTSNTNRAYLAGSYNVSHGSAIYQPILNSSFEGWKLDGTLWKLNSGGSSGDSTFSKETTIVHSGSAAVKVVRVTTNIYPGWKTNVTLPANTEVTLSYWHQEAGGTYRPKYSIIDNQSGSNLYLQADGTTWDAASYTFDPNDNSTGSWRNHTRTFTTNRTNQYSIAFTINAAGTYYLDDLTITPTATTYSWQVHDAPSGTYKLIGWLPSSVTVLSKCASSNWSSAGLEALQLSYRVANAATCVATENSYAYVDNTLYYHLATGETIDNVHIEAGMGGSGVHCYSSAHSYYDVNNLNTFVGEGNGFNITGGNNNFTNIDSKFHYSTPITFTGASAVSNVVTNSDCGYTQQDGIQTLSGASATFNRVKSHHNRDDGFQNGNATAIYNYCLSYNNGGWATSPDSPNCGWENGSLVGASNSTLYNCVAYGNYDGGFSLALASHTAIIKNCSGYNNGSSRGDLYTDGIASLTNDYNIGGTKSASWSLAAHEQLANPLYVDAANGDFRIQSNSPAINTGLNSVWSGTASVTDLAGFPITDASGNITAFMGTVDIGAYEWVGGGSGISQGLGLSSPAPKLHRRR